MILADSNVLVDLTTDDPAWADWSQEQLTTAGLSGELAINDVVFAEISVRYERLDEVEALVESLRAIVAPIPHEALFLAGKAFQRYRAAGGIRTGGLPDFFIGAHAVVTGSRLITRDTRRYRTYFPDLELIAPSLA